ncbi:MAG: GMC family oxidoreductase [Gemmatimonadetes bacterium]|nr:GMC family oxidoreductase [Gemmatimonadota bacterium]
MSPLERFDTVVVGSGFGGSVVAARLTEGGHEVCVLERGRAYPPGSFPRAPEGMRDNFWDPSEGLYGLFNVWSFRSRNPLKFKGLEAVVASGLGGGSLIYANVLIRKDERWFVQEDRDGAYEHWPVTRSMLDPYYDRAERVLLPTELPRGAPYDGVRKAAEMRTAARRLGLTAGRAPIAVTFGNPGADPAPGLCIEESLPNYHGRGRLTCLLCGECDIGCNYGSKNTLDFNYLPIAARGGASIRPSCEVRALRPATNGGEQGYEVDYVEHAEAVDDPSTASGSDRPTSRDLPPRTLWSKRVVLAAGTLGSTYLLLANRESLPGLSSRLGSRFCGNGDLLGFFTRAWRGYGPRPLRSHYGPVITTYVHGEDELDGNGAQGRGFYIEDGGAPEFTQWLVESAQSKSTIRRVARFAWHLARRRITGSPESDVSALFRGLIGTATASSTSMPVLGMGRDVPDGQMTLRDGRYLHVDWSIKTSRAYFDRLRGTMRQLAGGMGASFVDNPIWYLRRVVTVHPLGGCPMGRDPQEGVVDAQGRVFGHPGLYVADGAVMPGPVGPNPSLTIAALAERTAERILEE